MASPPNPQVIGKRASLLPTFGTIPSRRWGLGVGGSPSWPSPVNCSGAFFFFFSTDCDPSPRIQQHLFPRVFRLTPRGKVTFFNRLLQCLVKT